MVYPLVPVRPAPRRAHPFRATQKRHALWKIRAAALLDVGIKLCLSFVLVVVLIQIGRASALVWGICS